MHDIWLSHIQILVSTPIIKKNNCGSKAYRWHFGPVNYSLDTSQLGRFVFDRSLLLFAGNFLSILCCSFSLAGGANRFRRQWGLSSTIAGGVAGKGIMGQARQWRNGANRFKCRWILSSAIACGVIGQGIMSQAC